MILRGNHSKMRYFYNQLISLPEQEERSWPGFLRLGGLILVCLLFTAPGYQRASYDGKEDPYITPWLSKKKAGQIMRFHGTNGIKITEDRVYIKRDGRWICVYRDPSFLPGEDGFPDSPMTAVRVAGENPDLTFPPFFLPAEG